MEDLICPKQFYALHIPHGTLEGDRLAEDVEAQIFGLDTSGKAIIA